MHSMLKRYELLEGHLTESQAEAAPVWVYLCPDEQERRFLATRFNIDEHTLSSALDPDELSRLEFEPDHLAVILKRPKNYSSQDSFLFKVTSMGVFLFENAIVVVSPEQEVLFDGKPFARTATPRDVMLKLIFRSIQHFLEHLKVMSMVSDELEQKINASMENRYLLNLFTLEKSLVYYLNAIHTNAVLIDKLKMYAARIGFTQDQVEYLDDTGVENSQCFKLAEIYSDVISSMMDARASIVNNNLNILMKKLTMVTIVIMIPTFVVSAFSTNVPMPWGWRDWPPAFYIILGLAGISALCALLFLRVKRW